MSDKKVDGIKKISKKNLKESRKIVLESIDEEIKKQEKVLRNKKASKRIDGVFSVLKKQKEVNIVENKELNNTNNQTGKKSKILSVDGVVPRPTDTSQKRPEEKKMGPVEITKKKVEEDKGIKIGSKKRNEWKKEIESVIFTDEKTKTISDIKNPKTNRKPNKENQEKKKDTPSIINKLSLRLKKYKVLNAEKSNRKRIEKERIRIEEEKEKIEKNRDKALIEKKKQDEKNKNKVAKKEAKLIKRKEKEKAKLEKERGKENEKSLKLKENEKERLEKASEDKKTSLLAEKKKKNVKDKKLKKEMEEEKASGIEKKSKEEEKERIRLEKENEREDERLKKEIEKKEEELEKQRNEENKKLNREDRKKLKELKKLKKLAEKKRAKQEALKLKQKEKEEKLLNKNEEKKVREIEAQATHDIEEKNREDKEKRERNIEIKKQAEADREDKGKEEKERKLLVLKEKERKLNGKRMKEKEAEKETKRKEKEIYNKKRRKERKKRRDETFNNLNTLVKDLTRSGQEKFLYILGKMISLLLILLLTCAFLYTTFVFVVLRFDINNTSIRNISQYLFVPAFISKDGVVEYYKYQDYIKQLQLEQGTDINQADIDAKLIFTKEFIFHKLLKSYRLQNTSYQQIDDTLKTTINNNLLMDMEINQVSLSRIKKVKELIKEKSDFVRVSSKFGDKTGSIIINDKNKDKFSYYDTVKNIKKGDISNIILTDDGYYIFRLFEKTKDYLELNYVFIDGMNLDEFIEEEIEGYKLWSFVD